MLVSRVNAPYNAPYRKRASEIRFLKMLRKQANMYFRAKTSDHEIKLFINYFLNSAFTSIRLSVWADIAQF